MSRAYEEIDREDGEGWSVLMAEDSEGTIELDRWPLDVAIGSSPLRYADSGDAATEAAYLNAHPDELDECIGHARNLTGAWAPGGLRR